MGDHSCITIFNLIIYSRYLTQYDCVNFYQLVDAIRSNEATFGKNSGWMFMDAADTLFLVSWAN